MSTSARAAGGDGRGTSRLDGQFWRLFASSTVSNLADGMGRAALPLLAASLTRNPLLISALTALAFLPWLLFGLASGALVDRVERRRAMAVANGVRATLFAVLAVAVLLDVATIAVLYVVAFAVGIAETVYDSAARAVLPQLVRRDQLEAGNSMLFTGEVIGQSFVGAAAGSALFAVAMAAPLMTNSIAFAVAALLVLSIASRIRLAPRPGASIREDIGAGVRWIREHRLIRDLILLTAVTAITLYMVTAVQVLYVLDNLHVPVAAYGFMLAASGAGSALGGIAAPRISRRLGRPATLVAATLTAGTATMATGFTGTPALAALLFATIAFAFVVGDVLSLSLRQALIPTELFGRVQGGYRTLVWGAFPVGALAGGALATATDVATVYRCAGVVHMLVAAGMWRLVLAHRAEIDAAFAAPAPDGSRHLQ